MTTPITITLTRSQTASLATLPEYIDTIEDAFLKYAEGKSFGTGMLHADTTGEGEFHIKAGGIALARPYFALKVNGSSFLNRKKYGLPNIMGAIILFDAETVFPLAIFDSAEITIQRTGAATAVAAKYLARKDAETAAVCGYGTQGRVQLRALAEVLPIKRAYVWGPNEEPAKRYEKEMSDELNIPVSYEKDIEKALSKSDVVVTATPARKPFVKREYIRPGALVAAVGADSPDKQELSPEVFGGNKIVCDITQQCIKVGELHHAIEAGIAKEGDVHGELGEVIGGKIPGRESDDEIIIFDSTGTAIQDAAAAALCYEKARATGAGNEIDLMR
jgi:ornithine cyclodeaminase/alanine dehydrogenase-like protein (mu-crystallin family)